MKICYPIILLLFVLGGCSDSGSSGQPGSSSQSGTGNPPSAASNIYANGFRLANATRILNFSSEDLTTTWQYAYDFTNKEITITRTPSDPEAEPVTSTLEIDGAGRLVGGSYSSGSGPFSGGLTTYAIRYDSMGRVIEYFESEFDNFAFNYSDNQLDNIVHYLADTVLTHRFTYDAQGRRMSSQDPVTSETVQFEYNAAGQIASGKVIDQIGRETFSYVFSYDANGNHISTLEYTSSGTLFSTNLYEYEASANSVFNHGVMRQLIEPFESTNGTYVR